MSVEAPGRRSRRSTSASSRWEGYRATQETRHEETAEREPNRSGTWTRSRRVEEDSADQCETGRRPQFSRHARDTAGHARVADEELRSSARSSSPTFTQHGRRGSSRNASANANRGSWKRRNTVSRGSSVMARRFVKERSSLNEDEEDDEDDDADFSLSDRRHHRPSYTAVIPDDEDDAASVLSDGVPREAHSGLSATAGVSNGGCKLRCPPKSDDSVAPSSHTRGAPRLASIANTRDQEDCITKTASLSTAFSKSLESEEHFLSPRIPRRTRKSIASRASDDNVTAAWPKSPTAQPQRFLRSSQGRGGSVLWKSTAGQELMSDSESSSEDVSDAEAAPRRPLATRHDRLLAPRRRQRRRLNAAVVDDDSEGDDVDNSVPSSTPSSLQPDTDGEDDELTSSEATSGRRPADTAWRERESSKRRAIARDTSHGPKKRLKVSKPANPLTASRKCYVLSNAQDNSCHKDECYVCGTSVTRLVKGPKGPSQDGCRSVHPKTSVPPVLQCHSCLRSYHGQCLSGRNKKMNGEDVDMADWCCPKCCGRFVFRRVTFYRHGQRTSAIPENDPQQYLRSKAGLTGHLTGCGQCGVASSQRRMAVICDNCDREWHLQCLELQELPWGNWFCPDCIDLHVCAACILSRPRAFESDTRAAPSLSSKSSQKRRRRPGDDDEDADSPCDQDENHSEETSGSADRSKVASSPDSAGSRAAAADRDIATSEPAGAGECYYHAGPLVACSICYLQYHPECVRHAIGMHRIAASQQQTSRGTQRSMDDEFWCCPQCQEHLGIHRIVGQRRWIPAAVSQGEGPANGPRGDGSSSVANYQIQLLVKIKTQSYRRLMWLSLERVKAIYPIGARKWLGSWAAARLLGAGKGPAELGDAGMATDDGQPDDEDDEDDEEANVEQEDVTAALDSSDSDEFESVGEERVPVSSAPGAPEALLDQGENAVAPPVKQSSGASVSGTKSASGQARASAEPGPGTSNSSSIRKLKVEATQWGVSVMGMKRPAGVKKEWLMPARVIGQRFCPRGTLRFEYYVKWSALPYEESTWESFLVVKNTRALRMFRAATCLEKLIAARPIVIERRVHDDPTLPEPLLAPNAVHPPPPDNAVIVPGRQYLIQTSAVRDATASSTASTTGQEALAVEPTPTANGLETNGRSPEITRLTGTAAAAASSLEKRKRDVKAGGFAPYVDRPAFLAGHYLFDYQLEGVNWLRFAWSKKRSVILADEMGLGKTVQVVAFLGSLWNDLAVQGPFLVIAPLATLEDVWVRELAHWIPFANVVSYFGNPEARQICRDTELFTWGGPGAKDWLEGGCFRADSEPEYDRLTLRPQLPKLADKDRFAKFDVIVTSYEIFRKDHWLFRQIQWKVIVVDEGHRLKSFGSEIKRALEACQSTMRLLLTGTPLQNSIDELFSLLNVLHPEQFPESCKDDFQDVVTQEATIERLKCELQPHILRRTKRDVMGGRMPAKKERLVRVENSPTQREMYRNIILRNHILLSSGETPAPGVPSSGPKRNVRVTSLRNIVMQMRKCCNHPYLFDDTLPVINTEKDFTDLVEASGKLQLLDRMLKLLIRNGHRVLVFSQFMRMLNILEEYLNYRQYGFERLDGSTSAGERQRAIDRFNTQTHKKFVFLLSTRAGGLGINLTSADTVIIFDSDWNPHNDLQAQARAHRLGQTKKVAIYRFMTRATVEERIIEIARNKLVLDQVVAGRISLRDVEAVVRCGARELFDEGQASKQVHYDDAQLEKLLSRDSDDEDGDDAEERDDGTTVKEGVLSSFKVARFEDTTTDPSPEEEPTEEEGFWANLLESQKTLLPSEDGVGGQGGLFLDPQLANNGLGRGMRARREVSHFGHTDLRVAGIPDDDSDDSHDDHEDDDDDTDTDETKGRGAREGRGSLPGHSKLGSTATQQGGKRLRKDKKKSPDFFDSYVVLLFAWKNGQAQGLQLIEGVEQGTRLRSQYPLLIPSFLDQIRAIRRSLGLAEGAKAARQLLHNDCPLPPSQREIAEDSSLAASSSFHFSWPNDDDDDDDSTPGRLSGFQLEWDEQWFKKLLGVQLSDRMVPNQAFIAQHSERNFLICPPVPLIFSHQEGEQHPVGNGVAERPPAEGTPFAVAIRELTTDEFVRWRSQLSTTLSRYGGAASTTAPLPPDLSKTSTRVVMAAALFTAATTYRPSYPNFTTLRTILNTERDSLCFSQHPADEDPTCNGMQYDDYLLEALTT